MTLSNSRKSYEEVVWSQDVETFIRCHVNAFDYFGGVVEYIKLDNLKSGVLEADLYDPELNPTYLAYSKHCGFIPLPCRVRTPQHKGKVEAGVKYTQSNALQGKRFESIKQQNAFYATGIVPGLRPVFMVPQSDKLVRCSKKNSLI